MSICKWFKRKSKEDNEIKIEELIERAKEIKPLIENPHNKEYHDKLNEYLQSKTDSRDNFINWITGLTTGAIFFIFANISSPVLNINILNLAGKYLFLAILSAFAFKICLEVRYSALELDVALLRNLWESSDLEKKLKEMYEKTGEVEEKVKKKFLLTYRDSLNFLDENYLEKLKKPISIKSRLLTFFYWLTLTLFILGISLIGFVFLF